MRAAQAVARSPLGRRRILAANLPVDRPRGGRIVGAARMGAPVAELVDARDSKSRSLWEWEFESPRGHHHSPCDEIRRRMNRLSGAMADVTLLATPAVKEPVG